MTLSFEDSAILNSLSEMNPEELDSLPFGVVQLKPEGEILSYNQYESELAGLDSQEVIGKNFFIQVAPCTNNFMIYHRYLEEEQIDAHLDYLFTYGMRPTQVRLRMLKSPEAGCYLLVEKKA